MRLLVDRSVHARVNEDLDEIKKIRCGVKRTRLDGVWADVQVCSSVPGLASASGAFGSLSIGWICLIEVAFAKRSGRILHHQGIRRSENEQTIKRKGRNR